MIIEHICKQFMGWDFPETSWFSVSIYTSRHKTTKAGWERLRGDSQQMPGGRSQMLSSYLLNQQ